MAEIDPDLGAVLAGRAAPRCSRMMEAEIAVEWLPFQQAGHDGVDPQPAP